MFKKNTLKPKAHTPSVFPKSASSRPTATTLAPRKEQPSEKPVEPLISEDPPASTEPIEDDDLANMDYSILDDNENQFESKPLPAIDTTLSEAESYSTMFQNWENTCNMMNDQEETTAGATADEGSTITDEVCINLLSNIY